METRMLESNAISLSEEKFSSLLEFDLETLNSLLDEKGLIFFPNGSVETKNGIIKMIKSQDLVFQGIEIQKTIARSYGNNVVVQGEGLFNMRLKGDELKEKLIFIDVWVEKEEGWKLVSAHFIKMS